MEGGALRPRIGAAVLCMTAPLVLQGCVRGATDTRQPVFRCLVALSSQQSVVGTQFRVSLQRDKVELRRLDGSIWASSIATGSGQRISLNVERKSEPPESQELQSLLEFADKISSVSDWRGFTENHTYTVSMWEQKVVLLCDADGNEVGYKSRVTFERATGTVRFDAGK